MRRVQYSAQGQVAKQAGAIALAEGSRQWLGGLPAVVTGCPCCVQAPGLAWGGSCCWYKVYKEGHVSGRCLLLIEGHAAHPRTHPRGCEGAGRTPGAVCIASDLQAGTSAAQGGQATTSDLLPAATKIVRSRAANCARCAVGGWGMAGAPSDVIAVGAGHHHSDWRNRTHSLCVGVVCVPAGPAASQAESLAQNRCWAVGP